MSNAEKQKQLISEVQALLNKLELGTLTSISYTKNSDGDFYEYGLIEGIKKKH